MDDPLQGSRDTSITNSSPSPPEPEEEALFPRPQEEGEEADEEALSSGALL